MPEVIKARDREGGAHLQSQLTEVEWHPAAGTEHHPVRHSSMDEQADLRDADLEGSDEPRLHGVTMARKTQSRSKTRYSRASCVGTSGFATT